MPSTWKLTFRGLRRSPGFTAVSVLTLMLGAGATTAMFTLINALMLRPLPFPQPQRLAMLYVTDQSSRKMFADSVHVERWGQLSRTFESIGGYREWRLSATGQRTPERLDAIIVLGDLFRVLQVKPTLGREFLPEELRNGGQRVAILSHAYWQRRFASDPKILGRPITLDGYPYTIVGVMPAGFSPVLPRMPRYADVWTTAALDFTARGLDGTRSPFTVCQAIGRLQPDVTLPQAQAEFNAISKGLASEGRRYWGSGVNLAKAADEVAADLRPALFALFAAVGCVLLIACANIAGLAIARQSGRRRETAIRAVLGASRSRLIQESLLESLAISLAGSALGLLASHWLLSALQVLSPIHFDQLGDLQMDGTVMLFVLGLSLVNALLFGLFPALSASRSDLNSAIKTAAAQTGRLGLFSSRSVLIASEVALAAGLVVGAGLLLKSLLLLRGVDTGFETSHLIAASLPLPETSYGKPVRRQALVDALTERFERVPGVESVGFTNSMALAGEFMMSGDFTIEGAPHTDHPPEANMVAATAGYFHAAGMPLLAGRYFTEAEARRGDAALINEAAAKRFFGSPAQALGRRIAGTVCQSCQIVGVVGNLKNFGLKNDPVPELYGSLTNMPCPVLDIAIRTDADPALVAPSARTAISSVAPDLAIDRLNTMGDVLSEQVAQPRFNAALVGLFAALALLLAAIGVFGVTAYWVTQRTQEIGLRMALGAQSRVVLRMVLRQSLLAGAVGIAIGVAFALILTRLLRSLLFGVAPTDPAAFLIAALTMLAMILLAAWVPARRAAQVDPMTALRHE